MPDPETKTDLAVEAEDDTCESVEFGGHLQWINTADRLGSLCLECAIGTHSKASRNRSLEPRLSTLAPLR